MTSDERYHEHFLVVLCFFVTMCCVVRELGLYRSCSGFVCSGVNFFESTSSRNHVMTGDVRRSVLAARAASHSKRGRSGREGEITLQAYRRKRTGGISCKVYSFDFSMMKMYDGTH